MSEWSVRITPKNYTLDQVVSDLSGLTCAIVKHTWSYKTRKDTEHHIHIFWRHTKKSTKETFNDTVIKKMFPKLEGRKAEYCTTDPRSLDDFVRYALRDQHGYKKKGADLLYWNLPEHLPEPGIENPLYEEVARPTIILPNDTTSLLNAYRGTGKKNTTEEKQEKFYKYVQEYVKLKPHKDLTMRKIYKLLYEYSKGGFDPHVAPRYAHFVMRNYLREKGEGSKSQYKAHRAAWISAISIKDRVEF